MLLLHLQPEPITLATMTSSTIQKNSFGNTGCIAPRTVPSFNNSLKLSSVAEGPVPKKARGGDKAVERNKSAVCGQSTCNKHKSHLSLSCRLVLLMNSVENKFVNDLDFIFCSSIDTNKCSHIVLDID